MLRKAAILVVLALVCLTPARADEPAPPADSSPQFGAAGGELPDSLIVPASDGLAAGQTLSSESTPIGSPGGLTAPAAVPEPATAAFLATGAAVFLVSLARRRRSGQHSPQE